MIEIAEGIHPIKACAVRRAGECWAFAEAKKNEIDTHWQKRLAENPKFFNGRVFIMPRGTIVDGVLRGDVVETDFSASLYWRDRDFADKSVVDCFAVALLLSADGALIYGRQAPGNVSSGLTAPPSGFLDRRDVAGDGVVDFEASAAREILEETGFDASEMARANGFLAVRQGPYLCIGVSYRLPMTAEAFITAVAHRDRDPELEALVALRRRSDAAQYRMRDFSRQIAEYLLPE
ncbi:8-oxo-dGTP pyrophosphatase MutT (NUDIX family) [Rhizomicrobium palustre]|uniref:8-oxo-dGTP pyrophosphatase MutT (NUDIX family) n=1 Tax=Rhizomicrobium palustre TaxID=189966 RepID=A0A846MXE4_9PROT|nr:NUDIX hydrolase [Rhizomicrobium palustre]NIK87811.1 8-oxo-dGTP pyrophosphatase MutT (NUDIX family) [Rhizomicrobium palustre]